MLGPAGPDRLWEATGMAKAWLTRAFAVMRRDTKPVSEFVSEV